VPVFECSDLRRADLGGQPLLAYLRLGSRQPPGEIYGPVMTHSVIDKATKLARLGVITFTEVSDVDLKTPPDGDLEGYMLSSGLNSNPIITVTISGAFVPLSL